MPRYAAEMCNLYQSTPRERLSNWGKGVLREGQSYRTVIVPLKPGPYIKADGTIEVRQWGMIRKSSQRRMPAMVAEYRQTWWCVIALLTTSQTFGVLKSLGPIRNHRSA